MVVVFVVMEVVGVMDEAFKHNNLVGIGAHSLYQGPPLFPFENGQNLVGNIHMI